MGPRAVLALALSAIALPSRASAFEASLHTRHRLYAESLADAVTLARLPLARTSTRASEEVAYQLQLLARISGRPADWIGLEIGLDSGLVALGKAGVTGDGIPLGDHLRETLFLGETYAELQLGDGGFFLVRAGKTIANVGDGAVFDGYALGIEIDVDGSYADLSTPLFARIGAHLPDATFTERGKTSPLLDVELGRRFGLEAEVALFGALFVDGADDLAPIVRNALFGSRPGALCALLRARGVVGPGECRPDLLPVDTSGALGWIGARGDWREEGRGSIQAVVSLGLGGIEARFPPDRRGRDVVADVSFLTLLASVTGRFWVGDAIELGGFALAATGDRGFEDLSRSQTYHGYVGLSPRLPFTSIFFGGGLATTLQSPTVSSVSPSGAGLLEAGAEATWALGRWVSIAASAAIMGATDPGLGGRLYGVELDLRLDAQVGEAWALFASGGAFFPGSHYGDAPVGAQLISGFSLTLGD